MSDKLDEESLEALCKFFELLIEIEKESLATGSEVT